MSRRKDPATIVAAARTEFDRGYRSVAPPIVASDTFEWESPDEKPEFDYSRTVNPNRALLASALAELEGAAGGVVTNSGQSAALLALLRLPNGAVDWEVSGINLPMVEVCTLTISPDGKKIYAATHGRSAWVSDLPNSALTTPTLTTQANPSSTTIGNLPRASPIGPTATCDSP